jgi:hypothetical protein
MELVILPVYLLPCCTNLKFPQRYLCTHTIPKSRVIAQPAARLGKTHNNNGVVSDEKEKNTK